VEVIKGMGLLSNHERRRKNDGSMYEVTYFSTPYLDRRGLIPLSLFVLAALLTRRKCTSIPWAVS
jgi:hypothetical protein